MMDIEELARQYLIETDIDEKRDCLGNIYRALDKLITKLCNKYSDYAEYEDLKQESFFGVLKALETYDPGKRKFIGHVMDHLSWHLYRYVYQSSDGRGIIREYQLYKNYEDRYYSKYGTFPTVKMIAVYFRITPDRVKSIKEKVRIIQNRVSWDDLVPGTDIRYSDTIPDTSQNVEESIIRDSICAEVRSAIERLPENEREAINKKYFQEIKKAESYEERRIHKKALRDLRKDKRLRGIYREEKCIAKAYHWKYYDVSHTEWSALQLADEWYSRSKIDKNTV